MSTFIARHVSPGEPLTAQAWNDIVDALDAAFALIEATQHTVSVQVTAPGADLASVRVTAVKTGSPPVQAVAPVTPDTHHVLSGLVPGAYSVRAEAPGFAPATGTVTVGDTGNASLELALTPTGPTMPDLFGSTLQSARAALSAKSIVVARLFDFSGHDLPPLNPGPEFDTSPVLVQSPAAGTVVAPGGSAMLVVAVAPKVEAAVEVPSLAGLSLAEAQKALTGLGLVLGKVKILQTK